MQEIPASWCIFRDKEIQHRQDDCVATEHVIPTRVHAGQGHTEAAPDGKGPVQFLPHAAVDLSSALQVLSRHGERGHKHGKAAKQEHSTHQTTEPSQKY